MTITNLTSYRRVYFLGIKGAGMTGLAQIFKRLGKSVSGSDVTDQFFTDEVLKAEHIHVLPFSTKNISKKIDLLIYSTAYNQKNSVEFRAAKAAKIPMISYPQALGLLLNNKTGVAVCGTHGKTTTTAMLGYVLQELGQDPTVVVGSTIKQLGGNARFGKSDVVVIEADEYQNKLRYYHPKIVILTSADFDHPDYFADQAAYSHVFKQFVKKIPKDGLLIAFTDDPQVREIIKSARCRVIGYGQKTLLPVKLQIPGEHNVWNATAVLLAVKELGLPAARATAILRRFRGAKRRFELLGTARGVRVYDDYAHHPVEISKLLQGARVKFGTRKIWAVFQSHSYSRTKALLQDFGTAFTNADDVTVLDVFSSAREKAKTVGAEDLVRAINQHSPKAAYRGTIEQVAAWLVTVVHKGDVVITIGAGENWRVGTQLLKNLRH